MWFIIAFAVHELNSPSTGHFAWTLRVVRNIVMSLSVCLSVCLSARITRKLHDRSSRKFSYTLPVAMTPTYSDGVAIC